MIKSPSKIFVRLDSKFQDKIKTKSGIILFDDTTWNPEWSVTCFGEVVTAPEVITSSVPIPILKGDTKFDSLTHTESDIYPEVAVGDKIYFRYTAVYEKEPHLIEGEYLFLVKYSDVFCVITTENELIPVGSHVLMNPIMEDKVTSDSIIIPESLNRQVSTDKATIRHIGKPLKGVNKVDVAPGDKVIYSKISGEKYTIEGEEYVICYQDDLMLKIL